MPNPTTKLHGVLLSKNEQRMLAEMVSWSQDPDDHAPVTMSDVTRIAIRALHERMSRRLARELRVLGFTNDGPTNGDTVH